MCTVVTKAFKRACICTRVLCSRVSLPSPAIKSPYDRVPARTRKYIVRNRYVSDDNREQNAAEIDYGKGSTEWKKNIIKTRKTDVRDDNKNNARRLTVSRNRWHTLLSPFCLFVCFLFKTFLKISRKRRIERLLMSFR